MSNGWVYTKDRKPTREDADIHGDVLVLLISAGEIRLLFNMMFCKSITTHGKHPIHPRQSRRMASANLGRF